MKLDIKRHCIVLSPDDDKDRAFIEDTLGLTENGMHIKLERINNIEMGFGKVDTFALIAKGKDFKE